MPGYGRCRLRWRLGGVGGHFVFGTCPDSLVLGKTGEGGKEGVAVVRRTGGVAGQRRVRMGSTLTPARPDLVRHDAGRVD